MLIIRKIPRIALPVLRDARHEIALRAKRRIPLAGVSAVAGNKYLRVGLICDTVKVCKKQNRFAGLCSVEDIRTLVGFCFIVPLHTIDGNRCVFIYWNDALCEVTLLVSFETSQ